MRKIAFTGIAAISATLLTNLNPAQAALAGLRLSDGVTAVEVIDNGAGDINATPGVVVFNGSIGSWSVNVVTGIALTQHGMMDLNSVNAELAAGPASTLTVTFSGQNFTQTSSPTLVGIGGTTAGTVSYSTFAGAGNNLFETTQGLAGPLSTSSSVFALTANGSLTPGLGPFSLTQQAIIQHGASSLPQITSFDATLAAVPEPTTILAGALLLLPFGASAIWTMRRKH